MKASYLFAASILVAASVVEAAPPVPEAAEIQARQVAAADADAESTKEKKICRTERVTGSLTRRSRICLTQAQWREVNDRTRKGVDELTGSASGSQVCLYEDPNRTVPCY